MQKLQPWEFALPTYHFTLTKLFSSQLLISCLGYILSKGISCSLFSILFLGDKFSTISRETQTRIVCKTYAPLKLMSQLTTARFLKLLAFHILGSFLTYTISKGMVYNLFNIFLLDETSPIVYRVTQIDIV